MIRLSVSRRCRVRLYRLAYPLRNYYGARWHVCRAETSFFQFNHYFVFVPWLIDDLNIEFLNIYKLYIET